MRNLGLKIWSTDVICCDSVYSIYRKGVFQYVELFVVPNSCETCLQHWKIQDIPYVLHAPHSYMGLNLSQKNCESANGKLIEEVELFREALRPSHIIFHSGINGTLDETIRQILFFKKQYQKLFSIALIENKPRIGLKGESCVGASPEEIRRCLEYTDSGFCLDIGHAICFAKWANRTYKEAVFSFQKLKPRIYHVCDGDVEALSDQHHLHLGDGSFDLSWIIHSIPDLASVTIETKRKIKDRFDDFLKDIELFRKIENSQTT